MVLSSKVALCISGAAAIVSGGFWISYIMKREPKAITLEAASENKPAADKWWSTYDEKNSLVADVAENEAWWNWKYRYTFKPFIRDSNNKENKLDDHFKNVKLGYSSSEIQEDKQTSLNKACWKAYEKEKSAISDGSNLKNNIKDFCSTGKNKIKSKNK